jgi:hypothetical protein
MYMETEDKFTSNFYWYLANQDELVKSYNGKHLLIVDKEVVGAYDSDYEACTFGRAKYGDGNYSIQRCSPGERDTVVYAYSPIVVDPVPDCSGGEVRFLSESEAREIFARAIPASSFSHNFDTSPWENGTTYPSYN